MRVFAALLLLYPADFRRRYRAELLETFESLQREPQYRGVAGTTRL
jgi:hypothetical protein